LACGGVGLLVAGGVAASFTRKPVWQGSMRQLVFGAIAIAATYGVGLLIGATVT
jgi:VIT1/CCC1 family predicted Fe2+/Mn2+ transporter